MGRGMRLEAEGEEKVRLAEAGLRAERGAERHELKSHTSKDVCLSSLCLCVLMFEALVGKVCWVDRDVSGEETIVVKGLSKSSTTNTLSYS